MSIDGHDAVVSLLIIVFYLYPDKDEQGVTVIQP